MCSCGGDSARLRRLKAVRMEAAARRRGRRCAARDSWRASRQPHGRDGRMHGLRHPRRLNACMHGAAALFADGAHAGALHAEPDAAQRESR
eukprot:364866-Chlamydomonas_euryale.AAC.2